MRRLLVLTVFLFINKTLSVSLQHEIDIAQLDTNVHEMDIVQKIKDAETLVKAAVIFLRDHHFKYACNQFSKDPSWQKGELNIAMINDHGDLIVDVREPFRIWQPIEKTEPGHRGLFNAIVQLGNAGGGWTSYIHNNRIRSIYTEKVIKDGRTYYLITGFFAESLVFDTIQLVESTVNYLNNAGIEKTIHALHTTEDFRRGPSAAWIMDIDGNYLADANPTFRFLVGENLLTSVHPPTLKGKNISRRELAEKAIAVANSPEGKGWFEGILGNAPRRYYVRRVDDLKTKKSYIVGASFWPNITNEMVEDLVFRGIAYVKQEGRNRAIKAFADPTGNFIYGPLNIAVMDMNGKLLVDSSRPELVGKNVLNLKDPTGKEIYKIIINEMKKDGKEWVTYIEYNENTALFAHTVDDPWGTLVLMSRYYPNSKAVSTQALVESGSYFFEEHSAPEALYEFTRPNSPFIQGDSIIFVYDMKGNCLAHGPDVRLIWHNFSTVVDQAGKPIIPTLLGIAKRDGAGWATFVIKNTIRRVFIMRIDKPVELPGSVPGETVESVQSYMIGAGYYL